VIVLAEKAACHLVPMAWRDVDVRALIWAAKCNKKAINRRWSVAPEFNWGLGQRAPRFQRCNAALESAGGGTLAFVL
jgi:hypothetical protein